MTDRRLSTEQLELDGLDDLYVLCPACGQYVQSDDSQAWLAWQMGRDYYEMGVSINVMLHRAENLPGRLGHAMHNGFQLGALLRQYREAVAE